MRIYPGNQVFAAAQRSLSESPSWQGSHEPSKAKNAPRIRPVPVRDQSREAAEVLFEAESEPSATEAKDAPRGTGIDMRRDVEPEHLVLGVREVGRAIARVLANAEGELCFALYGPWGRGKTTLAKEICRTLHGRTTAPRYRTVWFNAWKYRSPAEVWAHLYECLAHAAGRDGALARPTHIIRSNVSRLGLWPLSLALLLLAFALVPVSAKLEGALWVFVGVAGVLGILGAIWLVFAIRKTAGVVSRVWKLYGALPSHRDQLGLQATIGNDLRHLLRGWISRPYRRPDHKVHAADHAAATDDAPSEDGSGWDLGLCVLSVYAIVVSLLYSLSTMAPSTPILYLVVPEAVVGLALLVAWLVVRDGQKAERVLLVVDDLDRCPPALMLEVLESIKLLVEERGVHERLQVMVLVDEEMLYRVVADRFRSCIERTPELRDQLRRRLVREHLEKIFLSDFRLGRLSAGDVVALVDRFVPVASPPEESTGTRETSNNASKPTPPPARSDGAAQERVPVALDEGSVVFSSIERKVIVDACEELRKHQSGRLGPRTIKSMILRYQLARLLLNDARVAWEPSTIAKRIVSVALGEHEPAPEDELGSPSSETIIDQVVGIDYLRIDVSLDEGDARPTAVG